MSNKQTETLERVTIRFAGDSGDGMQLTGGQFSDTTALAGNDLITFPDYPAEIRAPIGTTFGVSGFQIQLGIVGDRESENGSRNCRRGNSPGGASRVSSGTTRQEPARSLRYGICPGGLTSPSWRRGSLPVYRNRRFAALRVLRRPVDG